MTRASRSQRAIVVALAQPKGGVCKTTITVILAAALSRRGYRVAAVDTDPQRALTRWITDPRAPESLRRIPCAHSTRGDEIITIVDEARATCQAVVIDSPGFFASVTGAALAVTDLALIPIRPSADDVSGGLAAVDQVKRVQQIRRESGEPALRYAAILVAHNQRALLCQKVESELRSKAQVLATTVPPWIAFSECNYFRSTPWDLPGGALAAQLCERLADEVLARAGAGGDS